MNDGETIWPKEVRHRVQVGRQNGIIEVFPDYQGGEIEIVTITSSGFLTQAEMNRVHTLLALKRAEGDADKARQMLDIRQRQMINKVRALQKLRLW